jgi:predicted metal-dependent phosphotriesterase family hydrolase
MAQIRTARGPVDSSELGVTLMYERVFVLDTEILQNYPEDWGDMRSAFPCCLFQSLAAGTVPADDPAALALPTHSQ